MNYEKAGSEFLAEFSPDGHRIPTADLYGKAQILNSENGDVLLTLEPGGTVLLRDSRLMVKRS